MVLDRQRRVYTEPSRVREINHEGKYFNVPGPHLTQPSPQRTPVILQAGTSKAGKTFAAQHAEAIFVAGHSPSVVAKNIAEIRELAKTEYGRDPQKIKFLALICPIIGKTEEEAQEKFKYYRSLGSIDGALALFGGWTGINLDVYGEDEELRNVPSNAIRYVHSSFKCQAISLTGAGPPSRAGPRRRPKSPDGPRRPSASTSQSADWAQRRSEPQNRSQTRWSAGCARPTSTASTW